VYVPPQAEGPFPYLVWLSGLTCTEDNVTVKGQFYGPAPSSAWRSSRRTLHRAGEGVADDPAYDLGQGAGFYVDATQAPWATHFRM
jgi:S-formylglutathione hydrolase